MSNTTTEYYRFEEYTFGEFLKTYNNMVPYFTQQAVTQGIKISNSHPRAL